MTKPQITVFGREHLSCLDCALEAQQLFERVLEEQPHKPFAVVVELPYKSIAWENRRLGVSDSSGLMITRGCPNS